MDCLTWWVKQVQIIVDTQGQQGVTDLNIALADADAKVATLTADYAAGRIKVDEFEAATRALVAQQSILTNQVKLAHAAMANGGQITKTMVEDLNRASRGTADFGRAALQASYALEDGLYAGFRGVDNNIPQFVLAMGGPAGAAAAIGVVTLVVGTLAEKGLPKLVEWMGLTNKESETLKTTVERLTDAMGRLKDKALKDVFDRNQLAAYEDDLKRITTAQEKYNETRKLKSKEQQASESAVQDAFREAKGGAASVVDALAAPRDRGGEEAREVQAGRSDVRRGEGRASG